MASRSGALATHSACMMSLQNSVAPPHRLRRAHTHNPGIGPAASSPTGISQRVGKQLRFLGNDHVNRIRKRRPRRLRGQGLFAGWVRGWGAGGTPPDVSQSLTRPLTRQSKIRSAPIDKNQVIKIRWRATLTGPVIAKDARRVHLSMVDGTTRLRVWASFFRLHSLDCLDCTL
jgi:hypothetical protein